MKLENLKIRQFVLSFLLISLVISCKHEKPKNSLNESNGSIAKINSLTGKWIKQGAKSKVIMNLKTDGTLEMDLNSDGVADVVVDYEINDDIISFSGNDQVCKQACRYNIKGNDYYLTFSYLDDKCFQRVRLTLGYWVRENYNDLLTTVESKEAENKELIKARMFLAIGDIERARKSIDKYIEIDANNSMSYVNRSEMRMYSDDYDGIIKDCNNSIKLDSTNSLAYYFRGISKFKLNDLNGACEDYYRAIELGLSFLSAKENERCNEIWNKLASK